MGILICLGMACFLFIILFIAFLSESFFNNLVEPQPKIIVNEKATTKEEVRNKPKTFEELKKYVERGNYV